MTDKKLAQKIADASIAVGKFAADKRNKEQGYDYISADQVLAKAGDAIARAGFAVMPGISDVVLTFTERQGKSPRIDARVEFVMRLTDGETDIQDAWIGYGSDYSVPDKAVYKAITSGHKYYLMKLLNIGAGNEDSEHDEPEPVIRTPVAPPAQVQVQATNGTHTPTTRPYQPATLRTGLHKAMREAHAGKTATDNQRSLAVGMLNQCFANEHAEANRHTFQKWIFGVDSSKDLPGPAVLALLDWLKPTKDSGGAYSPSDMAVREALAVIGQAVIDAGQLQLPGAA